MKSYSKAEFYLYLDDLKIKIEEGVLFIHPTDTIYGISCDARNGQAVKKIRDVKDRHENPFSVIVPNKDWILKNCEVDIGAQDWLDKLPGPYTLILNLKNNTCVANDVNNGMDTLGVRMPSHWISDAVNKLGFPIITTSANRSGENFMTKIDNLNLLIEQETDFIIYEGDKKGNPSTLIDLSKNEIVIKKR